jgi:hypothetical protein
MSLLTIKDVSTGDSFISQNPWLILSLKVWVEFPIKGRLSPCPSIRYFHVVNPIAKFLPSYRKVIFVVQPKSVLDVLI